MSETQSENSYDFRHKAIDFTDPDLAFEYLSQEVASYMSSNELKSIKKAYDFAAKAHCEQKRKTGCPYIAHPLTVAGIVSQLRLDISSVLAAILHDTVEDTDVTLEDIEREFNKEVADLVAGLTKISKIKFKSNKERLAENFRKMIIAMAKDLRVIVIKLADRLHNMRTLMHLKPEKQLRIATETLDIYAPLAGRLGIYGIKGELEDLCLRVMKPEFYNEIKSNVAKKKSARETYIHQIINLIETDLKKYGFDDFKVYGRPKHFFSIYKKMTEKQVSFEDIHDLFAFRVIVPTVKDCYEALGIMHSMWKPMPNRFKDYIAMSKPNMYQSLHTTVIHESGDPVEIQIRTKEMHEICEFGIAAHWSYKEKTKNTAQNAEKFSWLRQIMEWQNDLKDPSEFLEAVKVDLFEDEIFVFTPKGDVISLSRKASCLDFAFAVHTDVGIKTTGAKINGRMAPLKKHLKSGDIVEVITSKNQTPSKDWLNFVHTSKAKNKIRSFLRAEQREKSKELGHQLLEQSLKKINVNIETIKNQKEGNNLVKFARESNFEDLLIAIGYGKVNPEELIKKSAATNKWEIKTEEIDISRAIKPNIQKSKNSQITVSGIKNVLVTFARCCDPLPGEEVIGYITRGRGVTIHRTDCRKGLISDPKKAVEVSWGDKEESNGKHFASIKVITEESPGILANVTSAIAGCGVNISRANVKLDEGVTGLLIFELSLNSLQQLQMVINKVEQLNFVLKVERTQGSKKH